MSNTTNPTLTNQLDAFISKIKFLSLKLWQFFVGVAITIVAFYSIFFDLKQPKVTVEITEIEQISSVKTDISAYPEFKNLRKLLKETDPLGLNQKNYELNIDDMQHIVDTNKSKIAEKKSDIDEARNRITNRRQQLKQSNTNNENEKDGDEKDGDEKNSNNSRHTSGGIFSLLSRANDINNTNIEELSPNELDEKLIEIDDEYKHIKQINDEISYSLDEIKAYREKIDKQEAKIAVTVVVSNSGDGATTLKPQGLLRTDLGQGNYLDINLKILNYDSGNSDIKPRSATILKLESQPIGKMSPDDRERFLNFFKNTSPTSLFVTDVRGDYYRSNVIPFAQGIYEQKIYDGLKNYASTPQK